jgi:hypothetical protein
MKISLSIITLVLGFSSYGQINQRTIALRHEYTKVTALHLTQQTISLQKNFLYTHQEAESVNMLSTENYLKPSSHSIEKAFNYYNGLQKQSDYSGFTLAGYSTLTNQQIRINSHEKESFRFFPANVKD